MSNATSDERPAGSTFPRQFPRLLVGVLVVLLVFTPSSPAGVQAPNDYYSFTAEITWRGNQALELCNALFVSGRTVDQAYQQELAGVGSAAVMTRSRVDIDQRLKAVAVGVGTHDPIPAMRAAYREGLGCVVMAPRQPIEDIDQLPMLRMSPPPEDAAVIPWPDGDRVDRKPLPQYVSRAALDAAGDWAFDRANHGGSAGQVTLSLLVVHGGQIVYERYAAGVNEHTRTRTWSAAKSISSTVIGIAVGDGLLKLDDPLPFDWPPKAHDGSDLRRRITLRHVLHMSSGLYPVDNAHQEALGSYLSYFGGWNSADHARDRGLIREPGTVWDYENYDTLLAVLALKTALRDQRTYLEFPRRVLFDRIGMRNTLPGMDRFGNYVLSSQVYTNARDLARLGLLYLNRGKWNGEQVLPQHWIDFVRTPAPATRQSGNQYGGHWWLVPDNRVDLPQEAYAASGARGQFTIVVPSYDLVVVRRGLDSRRGRGLSSWDLLAEVLKAFPPRRGGPKLLAPAQNR